MVSLNPGAHIHLIGIGGAGLSAIALVLLERGFKVSGSDRKFSTMAQHVETAGARVFLGHHAENVAGADLVVQSSAVSDDNVEVRSAHSLRIPILKRAEFLSQVTAGYQTIAVAGTHGKTTTTAMLSWILTELGQDPSYVIGGVSVDLGRNAHAGKGSIFVIEADEYDYTFLGLRPDIAVVTNVEHDHPDCYPSPEDFHLAFQKFVARLTPDGILVACQDDPGAAKLSVEAAALPGRAVITYGLSENSSKTDLNYVGFQLEVMKKSGYAFKVVKDGDLIAQVYLQVPGRHNVYNGLAALVVVDQLGLNLGKAAEALGKYHGTGRRFEVRGEVNRIIVVDDYAHHPTEIRATLAAARQRYPERRIWAVWQPHTYSRTRLYFNEFTTAFEEADFVVVTEVYPAREPVRSDLSARDVVSAMQHPNVRFIATLEQVIANLLTSLLPGDVLVVLSAGDADQISTEVLGSLMQEERVHDAK